LPPALKAEKIQEYKELQRELAKNKEIRDMIKLAQHDPALSQRLLTSSQELFSILNELDGSKFVSHVQLGTISTFDKLRKTTTALNELTSSIFLDRFGLAGITLDRLDQVYNPMVTGYGSLEETRRFLISKSMTAAFADKLAETYI
jgi:hypothetical protein